MKKITREFLITKETGVYADAKTKTMYDTTIWSYKGIKIKEETDAPELLNGAMLITQSTEEQKVKFAIPAVTFFENAEIIENKDFLENTYVDKWED